MTEAHRVREILEAFIQQPGYHSAYILSLRFGTVWQKAIPEEPLKDRSKFLRSLCEFATPLLRDPKEEFDLLEVPHAEWRVFLKPFPRRQGRERLLLVVFASPDTTTVQHDIGVLLERLLEGAYW